MSLQMQIAVAMAVLGLIFFFISAWAADYLQKEREGK